MHYVYLVNTKGFFFLIFERYELIKRTMEIRRCSSSLKSNITIDEDNDESTEDLIDNENKFLSPDENNKQLAIISKNNTVSAVTSYFSALFDIRKRTSSTCSDISKNISNFGRPIKPLPDRPPSIKPWHEMLSSCVIYTFMSFNQMEAVKNDGIIPESIILSSFWDQKKFLTQKESSTRPFRFSRTFREISSYFENNRDESKMLSEATSCCGINFRLLLCREGTVLKALLQKSKEAGNIKLNYDIYCVDHRMQLKKKQLMGLLTPVTSCDVHGGGHAYGIELQPAKIENESAVLDELRLVATIKFQGV